MSFVYIKIDNSQNLCANQYVPSIQSEMTYKLHVRSKGLIKMVTINKKQLHLHDMSRKECCSNKNFITIHDEMKKVPASTKGHFRASKRQKNS